MNTQQTGTDQLDASYLTRPKIRVLNEHGRLLDGFISSEAAYACVNDHKTHFVIDIGTIQEYATKPIDTPAQAPRRAKVQSELASEGKLEAPQASHSPLPWRVAGGMVDGYTIISEHHAVVSQKLPSYNARFIVRACNNAQRLADACKAMDNLSSSQVLTWPEYENAVKYVQAQAREALAQWEKDKQ